jgi:L-fuconolactonase
MARISLHYITNHKSQIAMTIDSHQHFWLYNAERDAWITDDMARIRRDFLPEDLIPVMQANGVDGCVAVQADQSEVETLFLLALADQNPPFIKAVVGWVDLLDEAKLYDKLEYFSQYELLKGFRHVVQAEPDDFMTRPAFVRGVGELAAFGFTYDILIYPSQLKAALHLVRAVPDVSFVIDHVAKPHIKAGEIIKWSNYMKQLAAHPHVHCKVSGLVTEADWKNWQLSQLYPYLDVVFETFGPDRLLFGSDWPVCLVAADYALVMGVVRGYMQHVGFSATDQAKVMGQNALQFYNIED